MAVSIAVDGLRHEYRATGETLTALDRVDLRVPARGHAALSGPSGAAKSTLLAILGGLEAPQSGSVVVGDHDLTGWSGGERQRVAMRRWLLAVVVLVGLAVGGCSRRGAAPAPATAPDDAGPPVTYVAVGASESVGVGSADPVRDAWPQVLYREHLPRRTVFVDLGISGATTQRALDEEVPQAVSLNPTLVTVWLNVNDLIGLVPADTYERQLGDLVHQLRRGGATKVLVANTPALSGLPAARRLPIPAATIDAAVDAYNVRIARVVEREGAVLVDLHAAFRAAAADGRAAQLISQDGFHPSTAGHKAVADAFAKALADAGGVR